MKQECGMFMNCLFDKTKPPIDLHRLLKSEELNLRNSDLVFRFYETFMKD